jgi:hypothetical protein
MARRDEIGIAGKLDAELAAGTGCLMFGAMGHKADLPSVRAVTNWKLDPLW